MGREGKWRVKQPRFPFFLGRREKGRKRVEVRLNIMRYRRKTMNRHKKSRFPGFPVHWILGLCAFALVAEAGALPEATVQDSPGQASGAEKTLHLSLDECIVKTLENNLGLAAEMLTPKLMDETVTLAGEKFYPSISFSYNKQSTKRASYSFLDASDVVSTRQDDNTTQISQVLPTGGSLALSLYNYLINSNRSFPTINPRYGSTLRLNFSPPLLQ